MKKIYSFIICLCAVVLVLTACGLKGGRISKNPSDTNEKFIGEDSARKIALERAGISGDDIIFDRVELDFDNGIWEYEVEFRQGGREYDANIRADDGTIISFETDFDD